MATPYAGNPGNYPTSAALPDDGDAPTAALFNVPYEALFDRTAYLKATADSNATDVAALDDRLDTAESDIANIETRLVPTVETFVSGSIWNKPSGTVLIEVLCVGGGGGGGGTSGSGANGGGGGGAGARVKESFPADLISASVTVSVGLGGSPGAANIDGSDGGSSSFGDYVLAPGGKGGDADPATAADGGDVLAYNGGMGAANPGNGTAGQGPTGGAGAGGVRLSSGAYTGRGYGAGGAGGQSASGGGGGGGAAGYSLAGGGAEATDTGAGLAGRTGWVQVTTWRTA